MLKLVMHGTTNNLYLVEHTPKPENIGSRIEMQTHASSISTRQYQHTSLATVQP